MYSLSPPTFRVVAGYFGIWVADNGSKTECQTYSLVIAISSF